jgi:hypothetical protein
MKLKINRVIDYGTLESERVELLVLEDCNLDYYMIVDTTYTSDNKMSNKIRHMHWFTAKDVKKDDEVILYSKSGKTLTESINGGNNKRYTIFWGMGTSVWNNSGDVAVLIHVDSWSSKRVSGNE